MHCNDEHWSKQEFPIDLTDFGIIMNYND
jgi:hypothetical protein